VTVRVSTLDVVARVILTSLLSVTAGTKLLYGHRASYSMPIELYYGVSVGEIAVGVLLWTRLQPYVALVSMLGLVVAVVRYWLSSAHWHCGCFGDWVMSARQHLAILSLMGLCSLRLALKKADGKDADMRRPSGASAETTRPGSL
jgi:hypothetical protein